MRKREVEEVGIDDFFSSTEISPEIIVEDRKKKGFWFYTKTLVTFVLASAFVGVLATVPFFMTTSVAVQAASPFVDYWKKLPEKLPQVAIGQRNVLYDKNGEEFAELWSEDRITLKNLDEISDYAKKGLIATEDKRFYEHEGLDVKGTVRAAIKGGGGSGITQQLVKNLQFYNMLGKDKKAQAVETSYARKIRELKLAIGYEKTHTKDQILLEYFNTVAFGGPNTYSIESAAQYYFGKSAKKLSLAESAVLVGSVNNPVVYNLNLTTKKGKANIKNRQLIVLDRMVAEKYITKAEADKAYKQKLNIVKKRKSAAGNCASSKYPFYCDYVIDYLKKSPKFGETAQEREALLAKGGLRIKTYLDPVQMKAINEQLMNDFGKTNRLVAPVAMVNPGTGGVSGFGVNRDYGVGKGETTINVPANKSGTGSTYKMVTLAAALENGISEGQLKFGSSCPLYPGSNYDSPKGGFGNSQGCTYQAGVLDYQQATAWSSNTWFLTLAMKTGMDSVFDMSRKLNLNIPKGVSNRSLSFVIGSAENSNIDMAAAYATFANDGIFCPATPVESYSYADGSTPAIPDSYKATDDSCRRVMSPHTASVVLKAMRANTYPGFADRPFSTDAQIKGYDAVGKSGTNQHYNYVWAQVSPAHSMFFNIYDMDKVTRGVKYNMYYRGRLNSANYAAKWGSDVLRNVIKATHEKSQKLDYNNGDRSLKAVPVETRDYLTIPSVLGMKPAEALATMSSTGITAHVSKEKRPAKNGYATGVIIDQSLDAGLQLPVGTKKEITLYISE